MGRRGGVSWPFLSLVALFSLLVWFVWIRGQPSRVPTPQLPLTQDEPDPGTALWTRNPRKSWPSGPQVREIPCQINAQVYRNLAWPHSHAQAMQSVPCLLRGPDQDVYVPFKFIKKYFDIYGELTMTDRNHTWLTWSHSYSKVFPHFKERPYQSNGTFLQFGSFDVEHRSRVKCVTASRGVPVSTQWDKAGYYYSTQISQYGLSHWSKAAQLAPKERSQTVYEDGVSHIGDWQGDTTRVLNLGCVHFDLSSRIQLPLGNTQEFILNVDIQFKQNVTISVFVKSSKMEYAVKYVNEDDFIRREGNFVLLGYGTHLREGDWQHFTRDILSDLGKGLSKKSYESFKASRSLEISRIVFEGVGCVSNVSLSREEHLKMFFQASQWLLDNQAPRGGWPVDVVFNKGRGKYSVAEEIPKGWYSAMASGHALSVLSRAYVASKNKKYLRCASRALKPFSVPSEDGGFVARYLNTFTWYEEYPTNPATFVLNGFMYSLLGLFDLKDTLERHGFQDSEDFNQALILYQEGMTSLKALLPLYDTGSGSVYDLRHFTMKIEPKIARWEYHSTHINLLYILSTLDSDPILTETAERWRKYMIGQRAEHN